ncbi:MAG: hypothetical protein OEQ53_19255, partial [Saprospiraceae bacterium]|nr:hypothetical protein [Saprospiraceae bacterium]
MTGDCLYLKILFLFCIQAPLLAQQSNPFEIKDRLPPKIIDTVGNDSLPLDILAVDSSLLVSDTIDLSLYDTVGIPDSALLYDSISEDTIAIGGAVPDLVEEQTLEDTSGKIIESFKQLGRQLPEIEAINNQNLLFIITVLMLLLLATLLAVNRSIVNKAYKAIANDNYLRFLYREYQSMPGLYRLFYIYFFINAGFFLYLVASYYHVTYQSTLILLLGCMIV